MLEILLGFTLVLTRISAFFLILPVFGWQAIPMQIKVAATVILSVFFAAVVPLGIDVAEISTLKAMLLLAGEATYGLALGVIVSSLFSVVKLSGQIVEREMGLTMAEILDPLTGENGQPLGGLLEMIFVLLFLSANGHHLFLLILSKSYTAFPAGTIPTIQMLTGGVLTAGSAMLIAALRLAAPMLAAFMVLMVALALLARLVPEMNILFISMPVRIGLGLIMAATFLPFLNGYVTEMAGWMAKLLPL
ncbi:MAG: flagellar biosynthetic protein FliR [Sedimentisphaerales bacterium]|jgi:flagellar biosynthetic protein FliR|nr:flagellar biosynthetic protein FliR [Sedimentisphaerales bacterium]HNY79291.1 flagellar biosynthetic protein FliR [Sedimentisphaerales bacterium]HOC64511.1 flagellar biosynthetic protein FliR [Sedimentisphaerales bacterium]HOH63374.1 flagellar biosynthetic protein FliR [Sedimentisphaerales bacterium]HPY51662.1 flagellar biosynthetic protein FliR [Sedimentisphaerales bacterium]